MMPPRVVCLAAALVTIACDGATTPTGPETVLLTTETWASSLGVGATRFYSFTVGSGGTVWLTLASVTSQADGTPLSPSLEIGVGIPAGTGCNASVTIQTRPALVAQLSLSSDTGVHCVRVSDTGALAAPVNFALRFTHP